MPITYHYDLIQHTDEWRMARCGILTASEMDLIITPAKLQAANNEKMRNHLNELLAQRINQYVEPTFLSHDMERGILDEIDAKNLYRNNYAAVKDCGFITNDDFGFTLGYSPDGLVEPQEGIVATPGQIEIKSRKQKYQLETILADEMPIDFLIQVQTGMLVSGRSWCDFISYCGGMPMYVKRVHAVPAVHEALLYAASAFDAAIKERRKIWEDRLANLRMIPTERKIVTDGMEVTESEAA